LKSCGVLALVSSTNRSAVDKILFVMPPQQRHPLDKKVSPNWRSPAGLADRKPGMLWSDRLWHWFVSLGGLAIVGGGAAWVAFAPIGRRLGILLIALGFAVFILGFPSEAQRNGYRE
jgi:hypothetical protein